MNVSENQRLLSSEYRDSGYKTKKKPNFTKLNILGNMKKDKLTRALSSGGPSMRPAIASATGGSLTVKTSDYWPVTQMIMNDGEERPTIEIGSGQVRSDFEMRDSKGGKKLKMQTQSHKQDMEYFLRSLL